MTRITNQGLSTWAHGSRTRDMTPESIPSQNYIIRMPLNVRFLQHPTLSLFSFPLLDVGGGRGRPFTLSAALFCAATCTSKYLKPFAIKGNNSGFFRMTHSTLDFEKDEILGSLTAVVSGKFVSSATPLSPLRACPRTHCNGLITHTHTYIYI